MSPHRGDQPHLPQLKSLLEASRELTDLLAGLRNLGESNTDQGRILRRVAAVLPVETLIWVSPQAEETVAIEGDRRLSAGWPRAGPVALEESRVGPLGMPDPQPCPVVRTGGSVLGDRQSDGPVR